MYGQSRVMLLVGDRSVWIGVVEESWYSRIGWWRRESCIDRSVTASGYAAGSHAGDTRARFASSGLICRSLVRALQRHNHSLIEKTLVVEFLDSTVGFGSCR